MPAGAMTRSLRVKPWRKAMWCIPKVDAEYVARMEDVLDPYAEPPDPKRPMVSFDESPTQLIGEMRAPTRSGSQTSSTASRTSLKKRDLFSRLPP